MIWHKITPETMPVVGQRVLWQSVAGTWMPGTYMGNGVVRYDSFNVYPADAHSHWAAVEPPGSEARHGA